MFWTSISTYLAPLGNAVPRIPVRLDVLAEMEASAGLAEEHDRLQTAFEQHRLARAGNAGATMGVVWLSTSPPARRS